MKKYIYFILFLLFISQSFSQIRATDTRDVAVFLSCQTNTSPTPSITINITPNEQATSYEIYRKTLNVYSFPPSPLAVVDELENPSYTDKSISEGVVYEYQVIALSMGNYGGKEQIYHATGYIASGVNLPPFSDFGTVLLVVDETLAIPLETEIDILIQDLKGEGWGVKQIDAPRSETFDPAKVAITKDMIVSEYNQDKSITTVFLIGRIAVPYSGDLNPDGHGNHKGAWPADMYYGHFDESFWTDNLVNDTSASRAANKNIPGDGKFDNSWIVKNGNSIIFVTLAVGRLDLYNMPAFEKTETELIKQYLDRNHEFRTGLLSPNKEGLVDDNFRFKGGRFEAFATDGWRNFAALIGGENVSEQDYFTTLVLDDYLFSYGTGGGSYISAGGIGKTVDFAEKEPKAIFTMLFGSYFGDWDIENNFLRAPLCTNFPAMTNAWAARPHWYIHHLGLGMSMGYSTLISQNNYNSYIPNRVFNGANLIPYMFSSLQIHTALMGDPTLTLFPKEANDDINNLQITQVEKGSIEISWEGTSENGVDIFRSETENGVYKKLNSIPVFENSFTNQDFGFEEVEYFYQLRTISGGGPSGGVSNNGVEYQYDRVSVSSSVIYSGINDGDDFSHIKLYPIPARENLNISMNNINSRIESFEIYNSTGSLVKTFQNMGNFISSIDLNWDLTNNSGIKIESGFYILSVKTKTGTISRQITVVR